jgi:predicted dehydrogenase
MSSKALMVDQRIDTLCRVLVVGVGSIGERHVRCFLKTGRASVSICEVNPKLRDEVGRRYEIERVFADVDVALSQSHDAVIIAVPADMHIPMARKAVEADYDVLIEKPLSVCIEGVNDLLQAATQRRRVVAVGYVYRAHPSLSAMRQAIFNGTFGMPVQLVAVAGQSFPTYRPTYRASYYANRATGGGAIQDALTHILNAGEWLVGPIDRLVADADHKLIDGVSVEDVAHILARQGDVLASYALNQFQSPNEVTITVVCERGTARFEYHKHRWRRMAQPDAPWQDEPATGIERDTLFVGQANAFLDAVARRGVPLCDLKDGVQTLHVNLAAIKSVECTTWQEIAQL